ncbi:MAG: hypothetical protein ACYS8Z_08690 [Planctomycetota bacterium]|jgi:hypothetical protein
MTGKIIYIAAAMIVAFRIAPTGFAACPEFDFGIEVGEVDNDYLDEISGIAVSRKNEGIIWAHNDMGGNPNVYAMDIEGVHLGEYRLSDAYNTDWEDMAIGPGPVNDVNYLYIGDIGDNWDSRSYVTIYRVAEPQVDLDQRSAYEILTGVDAIDLEYPDGARDAEAMMVDPLTKDIYVLSKQDGSFNVYRAPYPQSTTSTETMEYKGQFWWGDDVSAADISPQGDMIIVRNDDAYGTLYMRSEGQTVWEAFSGIQCYVPIRWEENGEAVSFAPDGCGYYTASEGWRQPIYFFAREGTCPQIPCDFDESGRVDFLDLGALMQYWLGYDSTFDVAPPAGDEIINWLDFAFCAEYWHE